MNPSTMRRFGAALVSTVLYLPCCALPAVAGDPPATGLHLGSRAKAGDGTEVAYDAVAGVFVVLDRKDTFWVAPRFYHLDNGLWLAAPALAGPWEMVAAGDVPAEARGHRGAPKTTVTVKLPTGREAVWEPVLKVFRVAGRKGVFLFDAVYYRYDTGLWLSSKGDDGPWAVTSAKPLPIPLRAAVPVPGEAQAVKLPTGETVVYDAEAKVFSVEGRPETAFFEGLFYEKRGEKWFSSPTAAAAFQEAESSVIPLAVRFKFRKPGPLPGEKQKRGKNQAAGAKGEHGKGEIDDRKAGSASKADARRQQGKRALADPAGGVSAE